MLLRCVGRGGSRSGLVFLVGVAVSLIGCASDGADVVAEPRQDGTEQPGPFQPALNTAFTGVGENVLFWGGLAAATEEPEIVMTGALVDVGTGAFTTLPDAPFAEPLYSPQAATAGSSVLVLGKACSTSTPADGDPICSPGTLQAAVFETESMEWASIELPPELASLTSSGPEGSYLPFYYRIEGTTVDGSIIVNAGPGSGDYWNVRPADRTWTRIPDPPVAPAGPDGARRNDIGSTAVVANCVTDTALIVLESAEPLDPSGGPIALGSRVHVYDLTTGTAWEAAPDLPGTVSAYLQCGGDGALLTDGIGAVPASTWLGQRDLTWRTPPPPPGEPAPFSVRTRQGEELYLLNGVADSTGLAFDPVAFTWRVTAPQPEEFGGNWVTWVGDQVVGVTPWDAGSQIFTYRP